MAGGSRERTREVFPCESDAREQLRKSRPGFTTIHPRRHQLSPTRPDPLPSNSSALNGLNTSLSAPPPKVLHLSVFLRWGPPFGHMDLWGQPPADYGSSLLLPPPGSSHCTWRLLRSGGFIREGYMVAQMFGDRRTLSPAMLEASCLPGPPSGRRWLSHSGGQNSWSSSLFPEFCWSPRAIKVKGSKLITQSTCCLLHLLFFYCKTTTRGPRSKKPSNASIYQVE